MSEQRTECAGFSCMKSTEHWRSEAAHVYINLSGREEVWHDISPGFHTAGGRGSLKADCKTKTYFTLAWLIFAFELHFQKKMEVVRVSFNYIYFLNHFLYMHFRKTPIQQLWINYIWDKAKYMWKSEQNYVNLQIIYLSSCCSRP